MNTSVTLPVEQLNTALESFLRNISDTLGVEFTGNYYMLSENVMLS